MSQEAYNLLSFFLGAGFTFLLIHGVYSWKFFALAAEKEDLHEVLAEIKTSMEAFKKLWKVNIAKNIFSFDFEAVHHLNHVEFILDAHLEEKKPS